MAPGSGRAEPRGLLIGGIAAGVAGVMADLLSPIYATSFHRGFGLSNTAAGFLVTTALAMMAVVELGLAESIGRRNLRTVATVGIVVSALALTYIGLVSGSDPGFWPLFAGMAALGVGCGLTFVAGNAALAHARDSERAFSLLTFWYMIFVFVMMSTNPLLRQLYPIVLPFAAMVAVKLVCLVLIWWRLPDTRALAPPPAAGAPGGSGGLRLLSALPVLLGLSVSLSQLAVAGLWTFAEELGPAAGLSASGTASFLGLSQLVGVLGTLAPWLLGKRVGRGVLGAAGLAVTAVGLITVIMVHTPAAYVAGNLAVNIGYWVTLPLAMSVAADLDRGAGRLVAFMLGMSSVGLAIGPSLAGPLLGGADTTLGGVVFGVIALLAVPLIVPPARAADRSPKALAAQE